MADQLQPQQATSSLPEIDDEVLVGVATGDVNNDGTPDILGLAGDFNSDGRVDAADYVVQPDQLRSVTRPHNDGVVLEAVDADGKLGPRTEATAEPAPDGDVDGADFLAWQRNARGSATLLPELETSNVAGDWNGDGMDTIGIADNEPPDDADLDLDVDL